MSLKSFRSRADELDRDQILCRRPVEVKASQTFDEHWIELAELSQPWLDELEIGRVRIERGFGVE